MIFQFSQFSSIVSNSLRRPYTAEHQASLFIKTPRVYSNLCPLSRWYHPTISSPVIPFSSSLQSFPASGSFQMSQFFASGGQSIGVSASPSILPMNIQDWFPLGLTGLISTVQAPLALLQMKWNGCRCKKSEGKAHSSVRILLWCGWWVSEGPPTVGIARQQKVRKIYIQVKGKVKVTQLCPTLCDLMDCTVHGILQARILECAAFPFSRGSSQPRDRTQVSCIAGRFFTSWATTEAQEYWSGQSIPSPADLPDPGIKQGSSALSYQGSQQETSRQ